MGKSVLGGIGVLHVLVEYDVILCLLSSSHSPVLGYSTGVWLLAVVQSLVFI